MDDALLRRLRLLGVRAGRLEGKTAGFLPFDGTNPPDGTYTPTYLGATTAGATTYTTQAGFYVRIGTIVFFNGRVVWTAATGTGTAIISLPFTAANVSEKHYALAIRTNGVTFANGNLVARISPNAAVFQMDSLLTNAAPTAAAVEAAGDVLWAGWFTV